MNSDLHKRLLFMVIVGALSACMAPAVKEQQVEQADSTNETSQVAEATTESPAVKSHQTIMQTWLNPGFSPDGLGKVLVIAINDDERRGSQYEIELTAALKSHGVDAVPRANILRLQGTPTPQRIGWFINNDQYDHILVTRLCPLEENELQQAGRIAFETAGTLGSFAAFWEAAIQGPINPRESGKYAWLYVETSVFESQDNTVVWRNRNQTSDPLFTESPAELIGVLTSRMLADGIIQ